MGTTSFQMTAIQTLNPSGPIKWKGQGQKLLQKQGYLPARPGVPPAEDLRQIVPSLVGKKEFFVSPKALLTTTKKSKKLAKKYFR